MKISKLSSKGQITIPREMQRNLNLAPNSKLVISQNRGQLIIMPLKKSIVEQTAGSLTRFVDPSKLGVPFEEIMEKTRQMVAKSIATKK